VQPKSGSQIRKLTLRKRSGKAGQQVWPWCSPDKKATRKLYGGRQMFRDDAVMAASTKT
jgi:hypothetical protein